MNSIYRELWAPLLNKISEQAPPTVKIVAFLHFAKTGGSTTAKNISQSSLWQYVRLRESYTSLNNCSCGESHCAFHESKNLYLSENTANIFLHIAHERYSSVVWLNSELKRLGRRLDKVYVTYRPAKERIASMFSDYWHHVNLASSDKIIRDAFSSHKQKILERYYEKSRQFQNVDGSIEAGLWFDSFANFGTGMPFMLNDVFDGSPTHFRLALANNEIDLIETKQIDNWLADLCGTVTIERSRVSHTHMTTAVRGAINDSKTIIDQIAERDWAYDQAASEYLTQIKLGKRFRP